MRTHETVPDVRPGLSVLMRALAAGATVWVFTAARRDAPRQAN